MDDGRILVLGAFAAIVTAGIVEHDRRGIVRPRGGRADLSRVRYAVGDILVPQGGRYPDDAVRVQGHQDDDLLVVAVDGGFIRKVSPEKVMARNYEVVQSGRVSFRPRKKLPERIWRSARFEIEEGEQFEGYHCGFRWNGYACPSFRFEVASEILQQTQEKMPEHSLWSFDLATDTFWSFDRYQTSLGEGDLVPAPGAGVEGWEATRGHDIVFRGETIHVYSIGAYGWCWNVVEGSEEEA